MEGIGERLVEHGRRAFEKPAERVRFTGNEAADHLTNDLSGHPHAFVIGCLMDRQVKAEIAWAVPYRLSQKMGEFSFEALRRLSEDDIKRLMTVPTPLHRYPDKMASNLHAAVMEIAERYGGNAALIWSENPSSAEVVYRFLRFPGVGPKIATMAANILARDFKVPMSDYYSIDISVDVHVRRVFTRLGLVEEGASQETLTYRARALSPEFPGLLDTPCWAIGREWCKARSPVCAECYMADLCPTVS